MKNTRYKTRQNLKSVKNKSSSAQNVFTFSDDSKSRPIIDIDYTGKYILNGDNNEAYDYINKCYKGSPTNQGIIDKTISFIKGKGLFIKGLDDDKGEVLNFITPDDWELICTDFKKYGQCAIQVIWEYVADIKAMKPVKVKYISIRKIAIEVNDEADVIGYYYCFDWSRQGKFKPKKYHKFDGIYKGDKDTESTTDKEGIQTDVELLMIQRPSDEDFYKSCDYDSALEYAELESELKTWSISHVKNGFQGGMIINANNGQPSPEIQRKVAKDIKDTLTGTREANRIVVSFNENKEQAFTFETPPMVGVNEQYEKFDESSEEKLIKAHQIPPILATGTREGGGMGNNSEEIRSATKSYYISKILPSRFTILSALNDIIKVMTDGGYNKEFKTGLEVRDFDNPFIEPETKEEIIVQNEQPKNKI